METHSLFSLEIVVEKLYLPNVPCRFPTIACKLLDFPVITIDLVDKTTAEGIREKVKSKADWNLPDQFESLKDFEDTFCFRHGKSCLFKICPQTLKSLLLNSPLYVMVLDTMPSPPKLTGNASIPLDTAIKKICKDMVKNGPDIPVIYKDTRLLHIYNLMAKEIGYLTFGYRLLYLGSTLLPHISEEKSKMDASESEKMPQNSKSVGDIENIPTAPQPKPRCPGHPKEIKKSPDINFHVETPVKIASQEETISQITISDKNANIFNSEQILAKEEKLKAFKVPGDNNESINQINQTYQLLDKLKTQPGKEEDLFQLYCPPPIFYRKSNSRILSFDPDALNNKEYNAEEKLKQPDEDMNFEDCNQETKNNNLPNIEIQKLEKTPKTSQNNPNPKLHDNLLAIEQNRYPYFSGILKELSLIDIPGVIQQIIDHLNRQDSAKVSAQDKSQQREKSKKSLSAPTKQTQGNGSGMKKQIPKNKSWIRCTEQLSGKKSSLEFGLTKTHILRLNKLRSHDDEEREKEKFQKVEKESTSKVKLNTRYLKSSKKNDTTLQQEAHLEKSTNSVQETEHVVDVAKERNEVVGNVVNALKERNERVENEVNVLRETNEVVGNVINVIQARAKAEKASLSEDELTKSMAVMEELPMKVIQKELEKLEKSVIKKEENKFEENEHDQIKKQSSVLTENSNTDETIIENKNKLDHSRKVNAHSDEESAQTLKSKTEYDDDKFSNLDDDESNNESQKNQKRNFTNSEEWQKKESKPVKKTNSQLKISTIKDNNQPPTIEQFKEKQKVLSFEEPDVTMHQNLSPLVPLSETSTQSRFSRGPSLQESNASYSSSMLSETPLPTPRICRYPLFLKKDSVHTDSVSSYRPSEDNDDIVSCSSSRHSKSPEDYSDDFLPSDSNDDEEEKVKSPFEDQHKPLKIISENKLGYTIW